MVQPIQVARNGTTVFELLPGMANRHGLITGATGTGKTVTLQTLAEGFSRIGVPVFMADIKGDLAGIAAPGHPSDKLRGVLQQRGIEMPTPAACPVTFWDVFGEKGHPVRATIADLGPLLLGRMLDLNETQAGVLNVAFKIADDQGLLLLDLKDLRAMLQFVAENSSQFTTTYGNVSSASVGAILRGLLQLQTQGADKFFGEPMLNIEDMLQTDSNGHGIVNVLAADRLMQSPRLYATFLLWMLSELYEQLPEIGDPDKPRLVFFFDEAHLLFDDAPKVLVQRIELVVRLIRSKGVGVYFATQNPLDVPDAVLAQLGNRVQHALRAFTPRDQKAVRAAAETMRQKPGLDIAAAITELAVGEALVSLLDEQGRPGITDRAFVMPPASLLGPIDAQQRAEIMKNSLVAGVYEKQVDRESAYEKLALRTSTAPVAAPSSVPSTSSNTGAAPAGLPSAAPPGTPAGGMLGEWSSVLFGSTGPRGAHRDGLAQTMAKSAVRTMGTSVGREIIRGVLGGIFGSKRR